MRAGESPTVTADADSTMVTFESEFSVRFTKLVGEYARHAAETNRGTQTPSGFFVQGQQTLTPRWFAAGRIERISGSAALASGTAQQRLTSIEEVLGFRVTPDLTLRIGHRARRAFGRPVYDQQYEASAVWWKRWF
jgi:hypothetical protein